MDFSEFLDSKQHIPEKKIPFYLKWVARYHEYCKTKNIPEESSESVTAFAAQLAKDHQDWQVGGCAAFYLRKTGVCSYAQA